VLLFTAAVDGNADYAEDFFLKVNKLVLIIILVLYLVIKFY